MLLAGGSNMLITDVKMNVSWGPLETKFSGGFAPASLGEQSVNLVRNSETQSSV